MYIMETFVRINELKHGLEMKGLEKQGLRHKDLMTMLLLYCSSYEIDYSFVKLVLETSFDLVLDFAFFI